MQKLVWLLLLFLSLTSHAQTTFMRTYGSDDYSSNVIQLSDGGFLVSGWSKSWGFGRWDTFLLKTDEKGDVIQHKGLGGPGNDQVEGLVETTDGNYVLTLFTNPGDEQENDILLRNVDPNGDTKWTKYYRWPENDKCHAVAQLHDGGFIIAGNSNSFSIVSDCFAIRTDVDGNEVWHNALVDFNSGDNFLDVIPTSDGGFALIGTRTHHFYLAKYNSDNTVEWAKKYGGVQTCIGYSLVQLDDGGFIIVGFTGTWETLESADVLVFRTDSLGNEIWSHQYGGAKSDGAFMVKRTPDDNIVFAGRTSSFDNKGLYDIYLVKIDLDGNLQWQRTFDSGLWDEAFGLDVTTDGGLIVAGSQIPGTTYDNGKIWLIRTDSEGRVQPDVEVADKSPTLPQAPRLYQNYPNPFNPSTAIEYSLPQCGQVRLTIHNIKGQVVQTLVDQIQNAGTHTRIWDASDDWGHKLGSGIYLCRMAVSGGLGKEIYRQERKLILLK